MKESIAGISVLSIEDLIERTEDQGELDTLELLKAMKYFIDEGLIEEIETPTGYGYVASNQSL